MKLPRITLSRNVLGLLIAAAVGGTSFVGARYYLAEQARATEERLNSGEKGVILVASQALPAGTVLTEEFLAERNVPSKFIPSQATTTANLEEVLGQRVVHALAPGDPILWQSLEDGQIRPFSTNLENGRRAITFPVDEINSFSGMLTPGDVIDLLYSNQPAGNPQNATVHPLLQQVQVLATGTTTRRRVVRDESGNEQEVDVPFATVTLHVSPQDAQRIVLAGTAGALTAVLRNPRDEARLPDTPLDARSLLPAIVARRSDSIELIVGNGGTPVRSRLPVYPGSKPPAPASALANAPPLANVMDD
jgi:pilus assembly protein CpaB